VKADPLRTTSPTYLRRFLFGPTRGELEARGANLLKAPDARGWGFVGYAKDYSFEEREVRVGAGLSRTEKLDKFLLVQDREYPWRPAGLELSQQNTISIRESDLEGEDPTPFLQVNNRFLEDLPPPRKGFLDNSRGYPALQDSSTLVVTSARLKSGKEVLTVFALSDSARSGKQKGETYILSAGTSEYAISKFSKTGSYTMEPVGPGKQLEQRLAALASRRIILYGTLPRQIDLSKVCEGSGHQLILRSAHPPRNLVESETRLQALEQTKLDETQFTVVDGLPKDTKAVHAMGAFAGSADAWLDFHKQIERAYKAHSARRISTHEEFVDELVNGESNLLVLVAHSTGSDLYLNGNKISIEELRQMPPREKPSRPRIAILVACDAGKTATTDAGTWWSRFVSGPRSSLAEVLVDKGYVDLVIAPDHKIRANESLTAFHRALEPNMVRSILHKWYRFALDWPRQVEEKAGTPS